MRNKYKTIFIFLSSVVFLTVFLNTAAWAAKKTGIKSVNIKITGKIMADTKFGDEKIEVSTTGKNYVVEEFSFKNDIFAWSENDAPELKIHLKADDNCYFQASRSSQIRINGATFKKADREDSATSLYITVILPAPANQMNVIENAVLSRDGSCVWETIEDAGSYEFKFIRDDVVIAGTQGTLLTNLNYRNLMTKEGNYCFKVRPISRANPDFAGQWSESNKLYFSRSEAMAVENENMTRKSSGNWEQTEEGSWKFKGDDGLYARNEWRKLNNKWYYFLSDAYMAIGWHNINDKWYYFDMTTGEMFANSVTPDGYFVSFSGEWVP